MFCCSDENEELNLQGEILFLNFILIDKKDAVKAKVSDRIHYKWGHGFLVDRIAQRAGELATIAISDEKISNLMSEKICNVIPKKMIELGIYTDINKVYQQGSLFVLKLNIDKVNMHTLLAYKMSDEQHASVCVWDYFNNLVRMCSGTVDEALIKLIANKLQVILPIKLAEVLEEKGLHCEIIAKLNNDQAAYFFDITCRLQGRVRGRESSSPVIIKEGVLFKRNETSRLLEKAFFILRTIDSGGSGKSKISELAYFNSKEDSVKPSQSKGSINPLNIKDISYNTDDAKNLHEICIKMNNSKSKPSCYFLQAESRREAISWIAEIKAVTMDLTKNSSSPVGVFAKKK